MFIATFLITNPNWKQSTFNKSRMTRKQPNFTKTTKCGSYYKPFNNDSECYCFQFSNQKTDW